MLRYTLRQLEYFVTTAECGSIAKAAARLNVSQPSVSVAVSKLEQQFGLELFVRHHAQGVSLTRPGHRLVAEARDMLRHARQIQQNAEASGTVVGGEIELACFSTFAPLFMPELVARFRERYPAVRFNLQEGLQHALVAGLLSGQFELALLYDRELPEEIVVERLASFQPYALLPERHPLAAKKSVSLASLKNEPYILLDIPPSRGFFLEIFRKSGIEPKIAFSSPSIEMVRGLVGQGQGFSLLVTHPHFDHTYDGKKIATRRLDQPTLSGDICLAHLRQARPTRLMQLFGDFCKDWFARYRVPV